MEFVVHPANGRFCDPRRGREILIDRAWETLVSSPLPPFTDGAGAGVDHPIELTAESLWDDVAARLRGALNETTFQTFTILWVA